MSCAFTGGPYVEQDFLAGTESVMVETVSDALAAAGWLIVEKVAAWAAADPPSTQPTNGSTIQIGTQIYTFKNAPTHTFDVKIGTSPSDTMNKLVVAVNGRSPTITLTTADDTGVTTARYNAGGSFGNGQAMSGWPGWFSDPAYGAPSNALWLGGYKWKTNFTGGGSVLPAIPCICYVFQAHTFDWAWLIGESGGGWPNSGVSFQFMSKDQSIKGATHLVTSGPGAAMRILASPVQFFLRRTDKVGSSSGAVMCGGSYFVNYDPAHPPANAWWAMGDWNGNPFFIQPTVRYAYSDFGGIMGMTEICFGSTYVGPPPGSNRWGMYPTLKMLPDKPGTFGHMVQVPTKYGGDPFVCDPMLISGDTSTSGYAVYRGQIFDSLTVCKSFTTGFTSESLAAMYPWSDGSVLADGITPRNRLSADFDQAKWENFTESFTHGSLFIVRGFPFGSTGNKNINYAYEGKA